MNVEEFFDNKNIYKKIKELNEFKEEIKNLMYRRTSRTYLSNFKNKRRKERIIKR